MDNLLSRRSTWIYCLRSTLPPKLQRTGLSARQGRLHHNSQLLSNGRNVLYPRRHRNRTPRCTRRLTHCHHQHLHQRLHLMRPSTHLDRRLSHPSRQLKTHTFLHPTLSANSNSLILVELDTMVPTMVVASTRLSRIRCHLLHATLVECLRLPPFLQSAEVISPRGTILLISDHLSQHHAAELLSIL